MKTLEELKARLGEIHAQLVALKASGNLSESLSEIESLGNEYDLVTKEISAMETLARIEASANTSTRKTNAVVPRIEVVERYAATGGFKDIGDLAKAAHSFSRGQVDNRFQNSTAFEFISEDGGVLVPPQFSGEIQTKLKSQESLLSRTTQFNLSSNYLSIPVDETQPWNGGITAAWTDEGAVIAESKPSFGSVNFKTHKLAALVKCTDELLADASALASYINVNAPRAIMHKVNEAILVGDGVGKPQGIINSGFTVTQAAEGGQTADTVVLANIINMESRLLPNSNAIWIANPAVKAQLRNMKFGTSEVPVYLSGGSYSNVAGQQFDQLMGKPILYLMEGVKALGDVGDLILADLSYYYSAVQGGIKGASSVHLYFDRSITAFKFEMKIDGKCPFKSPVSIQNGSYDMSAFITLAAR